MKPYKFMRMEERFKDYESYLKYYYRSVIHTKKEAENISVLCYMNYHEVFQMLDSNAFTLLPANNIDSSKKMWNNVKVAFEDNTNDIFIYINTRYIHDPMPIYQLMMMSYNEYICTDVLLHQDPAHAVYYSILDGYIQNNSKCCYVPLYDLIFTTQEHNHIINGKPMKRIAFYDETNTRAVRFVPILLHYQRVSHSDITHSIYAKKPTVNKIKNTLESLIAHLRFILTVIDASLHKEYHDSIRLVLSIYEHIDKSDINSLKSAYEQLRDKKYNMFESYLDNTGTIIQESKLLQDLIQLC